VVVSEANHPAMAIVVKQQVKAASEASHQAMVMTDVLLIKIRKKAAALSKGLLTENVKRTKNT